MIIANAKIPTIYCCYGNLPFCPLIQKHSSGTCNLFTHLSCKYTEEQSDGKFWVVAQKTMLNVLQIT